MRIACPAECEYLSSGQAYHWLKKYITLMEREADEQKRDRLYRIVQDNADALSFIEGTIVEFALSLKSLRDSDVQEAFHLVKETYRTEKRGVIYEHRSANPLAQALQRDLHNALEEYRKDLSEDGNNLSVATLIDCLAVMGTDISYHLEENPQGSSYLDFITRSHPEVAAPKERSGIILSP